MSTAFNYNGVEFNLDSDDWINESSPPTLDLYDPSADCLHPFENTGSGAGKGVYASGAGLMSPGPHADSPLSSPQDSASESSSSKRTRSSMSPNTASSGDVMMGDAAGIKQEWNVADYVHMDGDEAFRPAETINPKSIQHGYDGEDASFDTLYRFRSDSSGSSPDRGGLPLHASVASPPPANVRSGSGNRRHNTFTHSISHSMKTDESREDSPVHGYSVSHDSSPSAFLNNNSPSPLTSGPFVSDMVFPHGTAQFASGLSYIPPFRMPTPGHPAAYHGGNPPVYSPGPPHSHFGQLPPSLRCVLVINKIPPKSRVETQIPIKMMLSPLPPGIKGLLLPTHSISKPKLLAKPRPALTADMLELHTSLVCTSAMLSSEKAKRAALERAKCAGAAVTHPPSPDDDGEDSKPANGGEIWICKGCIQRERKRAERKKSRKPEEEENWKRDEHRRVIVFNTNEMKEWQVSPSSAVAGVRSPDSATDGTISAPMRIACYCRHHSEKVGFQVIFTIKDHVGNVVAQALSDSIMITDDHKTHTSPTTVGGAVESPDASLAPTTFVGTEQPVPTKGGLSFGHSQSMSNLQDLQAMRRPSNPSAGPVAGAAFPRVASTSASPRNLSRPASPGLQPGPSSKKRKASNSTTKLPLNLAMTTLEPGRGPSLQDVPNAPNAPMSAATSPFSPTMPMPSFTNSATDAFLLQGALRGASLSQPFSTGPPTPNSNSDQVYFANAHRPSLSQDNIPMAMSQMYSAPPSAHPSRPTTPNGIRNAVAAMQQQHALAQGLVSNAFSPMGLINTGSMGNLAAPPAIPTINKVIPGEGSKSGGIEVTILGQSFFQGLDVMFGNTKATTTTYWGESSLVCLLPPSAAAQVVSVTLRHDNRQLPPAYPQATFRYMDDDEHNLLRTALTVLSKKLNGRLEDVQDVARRIIKEQSDPNGASGAPGGSGYGTYAANDADFESQLLKILELIDLDDSVHRPRLNLQRRTTKQGMLHLSCAMGLHRFVAGLLARGANPDLRDNGGYTPLHLAALNNHPEIVRRLIYAGADPTMRTLSGETAAEVARSASRSSEIILAMQRIERHARSRSHCSLYSQRSSATSLKSLWEAPKTIRPPLVSYEYDSDSEASEAESPEYSQYATSSEGEDEGEEWLDMRRLSVSRRAQDVSPVPMLQPANADVPPAMASPAAAVMVAVKEQLAAQFQQFLTQATSITIPPNPLPEYYQAYLNSTAYQRLSSFVPNMGGSRPGTATDQSSREMENRWWDLSALMAPPSYDEVVRDSKSGGVGSPVDLKTAAAAGAAAEAEADSKCTEVYDQPSTSTAVAEPVRQLPAMLRIGRKNAITREQQEDFRRVHAEKRKGLKSDTSLYMIWIPMLLIVLIAWFPGIFARAWRVLSSAVPSGQETAFVPADGVVGRGMREEGIGQVG